MRCEVRAARRSQASGEKTDDDALRGTSSEEESGRRGEDLNSRQWLPFSATTPIILG
jgi:hypothetical protein